MASLTQSSSGGKEVPSHLVRLSLDPIFTDIDDFSDFYNFDDTVLDKLQLDSGTGTHPSTGTVPQATPQLEDGTPPVPAQPQKRKRGRPNAGSKDKQARKKRQKHSEANVVTVQAREE